jgi:hypothetical protein
MINRRHFVQPSLAALAMVLLLALAGMPAAAQTNVPAPLPATLLPYLQNPTGDGMSVCFLAQGAEDVAVFWRPAEQSDERKLAANGTKIPGTPWTIWKARLMGLQPGSSYRYQVHYQLAGTNGQTALYRFRTLDPQAKSVRFLEVNDVHNHAETLAALMRWVKPDDYEFSVLLGDIWTNPDSKNGAEKVFRSMEAYLRLCNAPEKPMLFVRGNHETIGNFADKMAYLFDLPLLNAGAKLGEQNWYYTLRAGPVWLLALDGGDDFTKRMELFQPIRQRQADWMRDLFAQHADGNATWRILLTHQPLYNDDWVTSEPCRQLWEPVLKSANIDLEINGHEHCLWKQREKGRTYEIDFKGHYPDQQDPQGRKHYSLTPPFPGIIGGGPSLEKEGAIKLVSADEQTLRVRVLAATDGRLLMEFKMEKGK